MESEVEASDADEAFMGEVPAAGGGPCCTKAVAGGGGWNAPAADAEIITAPASAGGAVEAAAGAAEAATGAGVNAPGLVAMGDACWRGEPATAAGTPEPVDPRPAAAKAAGEAAGGEIGSRGCGTP